MTTLSHSLSKVFTAFCLTLVMAGSACASPESSKTLATNAKAGEDKIFYIGTAGIDGVYYPAAGAMCILMERSHNFPRRCRALSTGGSIYNLNAVRLDELEMGISQSDWQYHAYNGTALFERIGPDATLRSVFSLHSEPFTLIARRDSGIKSLDDLVGKRVNIGSPGSGMRATMEMLMKAKGWTPHDFKLVMEKKVTEQGKELCAGNIDAMVYSGGHPNGAVQEVTTLCDAVLIPVEGDVIEALMEKFPFYTIAVIPGGMYAGNPDNIKTFGVKATLVTNQNVDEALIYTFVQNIFDNFDAFKTLHPVFSTLNLNSMVHDGNIAPFHAGALRYFREKGLISEDEAAAMKEGNSESESAAPAILR